MVWHINAKTAYFFYSKKAGQAFSTDNGKKIISLVTSLKWRAFTMVTPPSCRAAKAPVEHFTRRGRQGIFHSRGLLG